MLIFFFFFFQAEDGIRDLYVTGVQTCALPILGMFRFVSVIITRLVKSPEWSSLVQSGETLDQTVRDFYAHRRGVLACCSWTIVSLIGSSGEIFIDRKSTRLNSSHVEISYAVFC